MYHSATGKWECLPEPSQQGIGHALLRQGNIFPAKFRRTGQDILSTIGARQQLAAEADTHHGLIRIAEGFHQKRKLWKIGVKRIVKGVLLTAQNDKGVMTTRIGGKWLTRIGADDMHICSRLLQSDAELAMRRARHVFDNCNAHMAS